MKKAVAMLLALLLVLSLAACGGKTTETASTPAPAQAPAEATATPAPAEGSSEAAPVEVDKGTVPAPEESEAPPEVSEPSVKTDGDLVTITIPTDFLDSEESEEEIIAAAQEDGISSAVVNEDGSVTYTMTKETHEELLKELSGQIKDSINELMADEDASAAYKSITYNDDYSQFEILADPELYEEGGKLDAMSFTMLGAYYQAYAGSENPGCTVIVKNADTGEELEQLTYDDWKEFLESLMSLFGGGEDGEGIDFGDWGIEPSYNIELPEMESTVLLDENGIKVTAVGFEIDEFWGEGSIRLEIENNSEAAVTVECEKFAVNDYSASPFLYTEVNPGETASDVLFLPTEVMQAAEITEIGKVDIQISARDQDTYEEVCSGEYVTIYTSDADKDWSIAPEGDTLFEDNGILIRYLGMTESSWDAYSLNFYIENDTDATIYLDAEEIIINGNPTDQWMTATVGPKQRGIGNLSIWGSDLEEMGEETITSAALRIDIYDDDSYEKIASTETIDLPMG